MSNLQSIGNIESAFGVACPSCLSPDAKSLGEIPAYDVFAGRILLEPIPGGRLYACPSCDLRFRYPRISDEAAMDLYRSGQEDNWQSAPESRTDWIIAKKLIESDSSIMSVLDVGCFDGAFLSSLGRAHAKYGIEIHRGAAESAEAKGVTIVAHSFSEAAGADFRADCVVAFDVVEHVNSPREFLGSLSELVSDGGLLIVSTGNASALSWRFMGSRYWYCLIPEHISFLTPKWARMFAFEMGFEVVSIATFSHAPKDTFRAILELFKNVLYRLSPQFLSILRKMGLGRIELASRPKLADTPPAWMTATDHFIFSLRIHRTKQCN